MFSKARVRAAGAFAGVLLALSACGSDPIRPEEEDGDPKEPPPSSEAMIQLESAPRFA